MEIARIQVQGNISFSALKFEYAILPLIGNIEVDNESIGIDTLLYLSCGQTRLPIRMNQ